jgi:hypothetical protein
VQYRPVCLATPEGSAAHPGSADRSGREGCPILPGLGRSKVSPASDQVLPAIETLPWQSQCEKQDCNAGEERLLTVDPWWSACKGRRSSFASATSRALESSPTGDRLRKRFGGRKSETQAEDRGRQGAEQNSRSRLGYESTKLAHEVEHR